MDTPVVDPVRPDEPAASAVTSPSRRRTWFWWVVIVAAALLVLAGIVAVAFGSSGARMESLDPENPSSNGAQALASVISHHDVPVRIARNQDALLDAARPDANMSVIVTGLDALSSGTAQTFLDRVAEARRVVLVDPDSAALSDLGLSAYPTSWAGATSPEVTPTGISARCTLPWITNGDTISDGTHYSTSDPDARRCFGVETAANMVVLPAIPQRPEVVIISGTGLQNGEITRFDNAGVAIRTIAPASNLLWYIPSRADTVLDAEQPDEPSDIPRAIGPLIALAVFGLLALMVWRGRRFGPLVTEPLPAVVKAIETTQARGRLYHRAQATDRAATVLRNRTITRLCRYLGLPPPRNPGAIGGPALDGLVIATADATGRDPAGIRLLLAGPLPSTDEQLVDFTAGLTALEKEVRRTP